MKLLLLAAAASLGIAQATDDWLTWPAARAQGIGQSAYVTGRVGGLFDTRLLKTERSYNYKLAATWITRDVVRAAARMTQLTERLTSDEAHALVADAEAAGDTVVMVEIDPREGSGVIPNDWSAFLQPVFADGKIGRPVRGVNTPKLRDVKALAGTRRRNYDYDQGSGAIGTGNRKPVGLGSNCQGPVMSNHRQVFTRHLSPEQRSGQWMASSVPSSVGMG